MKEIGANLNVVEIAGSAVVGLALIALLILALGASVFAESEKDNREEFLKKLKEKEKKLQEKEEKLKKIEEQLRGLQ